MFNLDSKRQPLFQVSVLKNVFVPGSLFTVSQPSTVSTNCETRPGAYALNSEVSSTICEANTTVKLSISLFNIYFIKNKPEVHFYCTRIDKLLCKIHNSKQNTIMVYRIGALLELSKHHYPNLIISL